MKGVRLRAPRHPLDRVLKWAVFIGIGAIFAVQAWVFVGLRASSEALDTLMRGVLP